MAAPFDASKLPTPEERKRKQVLDLTQGFAAQRAPEAAAQALRYARETGVKFEQAEAEVAKPGGLVGVLKRTPSWSSLVREAPVLAERLSDPGRAAALQEDVSTLQKVEELFKHPVRGWRDIPKGVVKGTKQGFVQMELARLSNLEADGLANAADLARISEIEAEMKGNPELQFGIISGVFPWASEQGGILWEMGKSVVEMPLKNAEMQRATLSETEAYPGARRDDLRSAGERGMDTGQIERGLAFNEFKKVPGVTPEAARGAANFIYWVNGGLEFLPIGKVLRLVPGAKAILGGKTSRGMIRKLLPAASKSATFVRAAAKLAGGMTMEGVTEFLQELMNASKEIQLGTEGTDFSEAVGRAWTEQKGRLAEAGVKGGVGAAGMTLASPFAQAEFVAEMREASKAKERGLFWTALSDLGKESKTRERISEEYREIVAKMQEKYGEDAGDVSVPKKQIEALFQKEGFTEEEIREKLPGVAAQMAQAGPDDEITILLPDFAAHVAPLDGFKALEQDLRLGDEQTLRESVDVDKRVDEILGKVESGEWEAKEAATPSGRVFADVMSMLSFTDDNVARRYATMWTAFAESRAARKGTDVWDEYKSFGITISNSDLVEALVPEEKIETLTPEQVALREQAKAGDENAFDALVETLQTDELTGANTQSAWKVFAAKRRPGWYVSIDANDLKRVNDTLGGHPAGDEFLKALAAAVGPAIRGNKGKFFRSGGDEFAGHFQDRAQAEAAVQALTKAMNEMPALFEGKHKASISLGLGQSFEQADKVAGKAKERARAAGRSGFGREGAVEVADLAQGDVFAEVDETAAPVVELHQDVDEDHAPLWFFQSSRNVEEAKQEKGDAKSWMSILSKGVKKEELEFLGIEEWLKKQTGSIPKDRVIDFIESHDLPVEEQVLGGNGAVDEDAWQELEDKLGNFGISIDVDGSPTMTVSEREDRRTDDIDEILYHRHSVTGEITRREAEEIKELYKAMVAARDDGDFGAVHGIAEQISDKLDGALASVSVDSYGNFEVTGFVEDEVEKTLTDKSDIIEHIRENYGRNDSIRVEEYLDRAEAGSGGGDGGTEYGNYTLSKIGADPVAGTYRELLFYAPNFESRKYEAPHWPGTGLEKGLIAHVRFSVHEFPNTDPAQPGKYNATKKKVFVIEEIQSDLHQDARNAVQSATSQIKEMYRKLLGLSGTVMRGLKVADLEKMAAEQGKTFPQPKDVERINILKARTGYVKQEEITDRLKSTYNAGAQRAEFLDPVTGRKWSVRPQSTGHPEKVLMPEPLLRTRAGKMIFDEILAAEESVPDAPFKTTWDEFVAKRLLMWAAAEGFDEIVWPTGEIQANRYSLAQAVEKLSWRRGMLVKGREFESRVQAEAFIGVGDVTAEDVAAGVPIYFLEAYGRNGRIHSNELDAGFTEEKLRGAIGSALAQRMVESEHESDTFSGPDLKIGGEGMAFAYDKKLVSFMEKQIKKFGGKVEKVPHPALTKVRNEVKLKGDIEPVEFAKVLKANLEEKLAPLQGYAIAARDLSERIHTTLLNASADRNVREPRSIADLQNLVEDLEAQATSWQAEVNLIPTMIKKARAANGDWSEFENRGGYIATGGDITDTLDKFRNLKKRIEAGKRVIAAKEAPRQMVARIRAEESFVGRKITDEEKAKLKEELEGEIVADKERLKAAKRELALMGDEPDLEDPAWWRENVEPRYNAQIQMHKDLVTEIEKLSRQRAELGISSGEFSDVTAVVSKLENAAGFLKDTISGSINDPMYGIKQAIRLGQRYTTEFEDDLTIFKQTTGIDLSGEFEAKTEKDETLVWKADFPETLREQIKTKGMPLFQRGASEKQGEDYRGKIEFDDTRKWFKITLTGSANLSTFLHESGHAFLEILRRDALAGHAQSAADLAIVERWMAAGGGDRTAQLERFARGFERYLMEGKAPSTRLAEIFTAFTEWLKFVYASITRLKVDLTPEVREVMDRLLATDNEIANARQATGLTGPALGPTELEPAQLQAFNDRYEKAIQAKRDEMVQDAMVSLRRAVKDAQSNIRKQVEQESLTSAPHARAWNAFEFLRTGKTLDGSTVAPEAGRKLKKATIREYVEEGDRRFIKLGKLIAEDGMDADALAPFLGFDSGQDLVTALLDAPSRAGWIKAQTDARMADKYPNATLASLAEEAVQKLHSPEIDRVLEEELDAFERKTGATPAPRARDVLRLAAKKRVSEMSIQEMQPGVHLRNEERASREVLEAVSKKDYAAARDARRRQMWHRFMYRETSKAKEEINKIRDYLHGFEELPVRKRVGKAGERYIEAIDAILEGIDLSKSTNTALARRASLEKYLQEMEAEGEPVTVPPELRAELGLKSWKQMTFAEIQTVRDAVANLEALARLKNKLFDGRKRREFVVTTTKLSEHIRANVGVNYTDGIGEPSWWDLKKEFLRKSRANMSKIEFICRVLDGGKTAGWAHELIFQPIADAQDRKVKMTKEITEVLMRPFKEMTLKDRLRFDRTVDFLGHKLRYRELIALILNLGNEGNKEKALKGFNMSEEVVQNRLDEMYAKGEILDSDLDLVQHIWDTINKLWPETRSLAQRITGIAPPKVEAAPLTVGKRTLAGGYYPVVYNRRLDHKAEQIAQRKTGDLFENNFRGVLVSMGFTEERTKFFAPISLSLDVIPSHINEVIHYVAYYEAVHAVDKLTSSKVVKEAVTEGLGREVFQLFRPWLQAIAADGNVHESTKWYDAVLRRLRLGSSIALLGFKVTTGLKQIFGLATSAKEIGRYSLTGARILVGNIFTGKGFGEITSLSSEFANIDAQHDRDIGAMFRSLEGTFSIYGQAKDKMAHFALAWMMLNQKAVNAATWYGAREKALREGHEDPVRYANSVVRMTQSGGGLKDLAAIQRGSEMEKTLTVMYTYFSVVFNQITEAMPNKSRGQKVAILAARWWWLVTLPVLLDAVAAAGIPDDDKDKERYLEALTYGQIMYFGRSIPLVGQVAESFVGERQARYGAWIETLLRGAQSSKDVLSGDATKSDVKNVADLLGAASGLPASAAKNAFAFMDEYLSGNMQEPIQSLLFRTPADYK